MRRDDPGHRRQRGALVAPQPAGFSWYPHSFLAPVADNELGLSSGVNLIGRILRSLKEGGLAAERVVLLGFSQRACLTLEHAARNARRYGGVVASSDGLIGPDGTAVGLRWRLRWHTRLPGVQRRRSSHPLRSPGPAGCWTIWLEEREGVEAVLDKRGGCYKISNMLKI